MTDPQDALFDCDTPPASRKGRSARTTAAFNPTEEQAAAVDAFRNGDDLVLQAGAGAGKTSTLKLLAAANPASSGLYVAFGKDIAAKAKREFPANASCSTAHALAYRAIGYRFKTRLNGPRQRAREVARILGIPTRIHIHPEVPDLAATQIARIVNDTIARYCRSDAREIEVRHIPKINGYEVPGARIALSEAVLPLARKAWSDLTKISGQLKFSHDHYLKLWQLSEPRLDTDFILFDEAQDADPVIYAVMSAQHHAQRIAVGDSAQAIYEWRGAIDAMNRWGGKELTLSQSFRFGPTIAAEANKWLALLQAPLRLSGYDGIDSRIGRLERPDAVLCRTNAGAMREVLLALSAGRRVALAGGGEAMRRLASAAVTLKAGVGTDHPELFAFRTWAEVQEYVETDSAGADLKVFVSLIDEYGPDVIIDAVERLADPSRAEFVVSTAHKAKGLEWGGVCIGGDFFEPREKDGKVLIPATEARLCYVAVTRAKHVLDRVGVAWVDGIDGIAEPHHESNH